MADPRFAHCPECAGGRVDCPRCDGEGIVEVQADVIADDVLEWLTDSYTDEGIGVWVRFYVKHPDKRGHLLRMARTPSGGT